jgi:hypothetical protein
LSQRRTYSHLVLVALLLAVGHPAHAQWLTLPTPGVPRTADGRVPLNAPAPRTAQGRPDLSGLWRGPGPFLNPIRPTPDALRPWATELARQRQDEFSRTRPSYQCLPSGPEGIGGLKRVMQTPTLIAIMNEDLTYRQIFMDGRQLEQSPFPTWMGYSIGRWEVDTLVVRSNGFNDRTWLNRSGVPHTEGLEIIERYQRIDLGHLKLDITFIDAAFTKPLSFTVNMELAVDTEMIESVCEVGSTTWSGHVSDLQRDGVTLTRAVLARYVGTYSGPFAGRIRVLEVALRDDTLYIDGLSTAGAEALTPLSETLFMSTGGLPYEFVKDQQGSTSEMIETHVDGGVTYSRVR